MKRFISLSAILMLIAFTGCYVVGCMGQNYADMTSKDRASVAMKLYVGAAMDYERDVKRPGLTDGHIDYLKDKKKFLDESYPIIKLYRTYAETGMMPTLGMEQNLLRLIDEFVLYPALGY